jgi:Ring finger domain
MSPVAWLIPRIFDPILHDECVMNEPSCEKLVSEFTKHIGENNIRRLDHVSSDTYYQLSHIRDLLVTKSFVAKLALALSEVESTMETVARLAILYKDEWPFWESLLSHSDTEEEIIHQFKLLAEYPKNIGIKDHIKNACTEFNDQILAIDYPKTDLKMLLPDKNRSLLQTVCLRNNIYLFVTNWYKEIRANFHDDPFLVRNKFIEIFMSPDYYAKLTELRMYVQSAPIEMSPFLKISCLASDTYLQNCMELFEMFNFYLSFGIERFQKLKKYLNISSKFWDSPDLVEKLYQYLSLHEDFISEYSPVFDDMIYGMTRNHETLYFEFKVIKTVWYFFEEINNWPFWEELIMDEKNKLQSPEELLLLFIEKFDDAMFKYEDRFPLVEIFRKNCEKRDIEKTSENQEVLEICNDPTLPGIVKYLKKLDLMEIIDPELQQGFVRYVDSYVEDFIFYKYPKHIHIKLDETAEGVCGICMENIERGDMWKICGEKQSVHSSCINIWLRIKSTCPFCRKHIHNYP